ncbi:MAG: crossover junction endodeoxyribonuclease RuvC [Planctomycetes bacterium]|nr:crossover junction endodeoxyribonuclease RuvC [Planctomycetota bacterium]
MLGIDPGLQRTGYAILSAPTHRDVCRVVEAGVIRLDPRQPIECRLVELESSLDQLISTHRPTVMACEQLYAHYRHPRTAIIMAHARGVILALAARRGLEIVHVAATHVKKHLTGSGRAGKAQIQRAVAATLNLPQIPEPDDVADAMAVALCGLRMRAAESQVNQSSRAVTKGGRGSRRAATITTGARP